MVNTCAVHNLRFKHTIISMIETMERLGYEDYSLSFGDMKLNQDELYDEMGIVEYRYIDQGLRYDMLESNFLFTLVSGEQVVLWCRCKYEWEEKGWMRK